MSFESAIRICPRTRACTFCSARSQSGRPCARSSCARKAACIGSIGILLEPHAEVPRELGGVLARVARAVARRHRDAEDRVRPERLGGDAGGEGGVDAAREPHDRRAEAALADVVLHPEDERREHLVRERRPARPRAAAGGRRRRGRAPARRRRSGRRRRAPPRTAAPARGSRPSGADEHRAPVEHERVVAAHLVHVGDRHPVAPRARREHPLAQRGLVDRVRRRGDVHDHRRAGLGELADRVARVARPIPEPLVVPDVLADGEAEPEGPPRPRRWSGRPAGSSGSRRRRRRSAGATCARPRRRARRRAARPSCRRPAGPPRGPPPGSRARGRRRGTTRRGRRGPRARARSGRGTRGDRGSRAADTRRAPARGRRRAKPRRPAPAPSPRGSSPRCRRSRRRSCRSARARCGRMEARGDDGTLTAR